MKSKKMYIILIMALAINTEIILGQEAISPPIAKIILKSGYGSR